MEGTYPNKSKSFPIWRPWLQVSKELEPGPVNPRLLSLKKKRGSQVCLPGEGLSTRRRGVAGRGGKAVSPVRQGLASSGAGKPEARPTVGRWARWAQRLVASSGLGGGSLERASRCFLFLWETLHSRGIGAALWQATYRVNGYSNISEKPGSPRLGAGLLGLLLSPVGNSFSSLGKALDLPGFQFPNGQRATGILFLPNPVSWA